MPDEPTPPHPLEAALRAQAERRRAELDAGRPPALPGPVRAALLRELERGATPTREERSRSAPWWWRWQTLLATTACVLLAVGIFRRGVEPFSQRTEKAPPPPGAVAEKQQQEAAGPSASAADERRERAASPALEQGTPRDADVAIVPPAPPAPAAAPAPVTRPAPPSEAPGRESADRPPASFDESPTRGVAAAGSASSSEAPAVRIQPPASAGGGAVRSPGSSPGALLGAAKPAPTAAVASQRFLQTPLQQTLRSARAVGSSPVLTDFTLRREGDTLVIRDGDGSEYRAPLAAAKEAASSTDALKKDAARRRAAANGPSTTEDQPVAFRATGVNQTLKQTVVIEGILRPAPAEESLAAAPPARPKAAAAPAPAKPQAPASRAVAPNRASIRGRAIISDQEYAIEAEEAAPPAKR